MSCSAPPVHIPPGILVNPSRETQRDRPARTAPRQHHVVNRIQCATAHTIRHHHLCQRIFFNKNRPVPLFQPVLLH